MSGRIAAIQAIAGGTKENRRWPVFADHDDGGADAAKVETFMPRRSLSQKTIVQSTSKAIGGPLGGLRPIGGREIGLPGGGAGRPLGVPRAGGPLGVAIIDIPPRMDSPGSDSSGLIACIISDADPGVAMTPVGVSVTPNRPRVNRPGNTDLILAA